MAANELHRTPSPPLAQPDAGALNSPAKKSNNPFEVEPPVIAAVTATTPSPPPTEPVVPQMPTRPNPSDPINEASQPEAPPPPSDPRIAALKAMFPDFDDDTLLFVLESVGGDQERAIDTLLGMNDPEYRSDTNRPAQSAQMSQTELDEQFARQLMLQEQQEQQEVWRAQHQQPPQHGGYAPYISQQPHTRSAPQRQPTSEGDTMGEFQQQFNRIAESGKRSLGAFFTKVKAKINEFDQPRAEQGTSGYYPQQQESWDSPPAPSQGTTTWAQRQQRQASFFDPNTPAPPPRNMNTEPITTPPTNVPPPSATSTAQPTIVPDMPRTASPGPVTTESNISQTPPPPRTNAGSPPIDGGKVGLLPKRPVSLIRPDETTPQRQRRDSEETLEYAENPFEEAGRR